MLRLIFSTFLLVGANAIKSNFYFASQGETIACDLYHNPSSIGRSPIVVSAPGFPSTRELFFAPYGEGLSNAGIALICCDYVGFGSSGGKQRQDVVINDQHTLYKDALTVVSRDARFDPERMGVFGKSLSGAHTIYMASTDDRVKAAVAIVPHVAGSIEAVTQHAKFAPDIAEDLLAKSVGGPRTMVTVYGPPGARAVMTTDGAEQYLGSKTPGTTYRNECTASSMAQIATYDVTSEGKAIKIPIVAVAAISDTITPARNIHNALDRVASAKVIDMAGEHFTVITPNEAKLVDITVKHFQTYL